MLLPHDAVRYHVIGYCEHLFVPVHVFVVVLPLLRANFDRVLKLESLRQRVLRFALCLFLQPPRLEVLLLRVSDSGVLLATVEGLARGGLQCRPRPWLTICSSGQRAVVTRQFFVAESWELAQDLLDDTRVDNSLLVLGTSRNELGIRSCSGDR
jgi:hypothetical protein